MEKTGNIIIVGLAIIIGFIAGKGIQKHKMIGNTSDEHIFYVLENGEYKLANAKVVK
jgi:hypothetical protein